jgi:predicted DNA-binding transcriptional regulator AlpA
MSSQPSTKPQSVPTPGMTVVSATPKNINQREDHTSPLTIHQFGTMPAGQQQEPFNGRERDPLLTAQDVAERLNVTKDWVWDHSSRKAPLLPVIRMGDGTLRYRASRIEEFIDQQERLTQIRRKRA